MVGKKGLFEHIQCTASGLKRQFDKWHLFCAPTCVGFLSQERMGGHGGRVGGCVGRGEAKDLFCRGRNSHHAMYGSPRTLPYQKVLRSY